jgi:uncharacterized membrane protein
MNGENNNEKIARTKSPENQKSQLVARRQEASLYYSGPIPPPNVLAQYNDIIPDGANRIMKMAERQGEHRERLEWEVIRSNVSAQKMGAIFAFIIVMTAICLGSYLILRGKSIFGLIQMLAVVGAVAAMFVYSKETQKKERIRKNLDLQAVDKENVEN